MVACVLTEIAFIKYFSTIFFNGRPRILASNDANRSSPPPYIPFRSNYWPFVVFVCCFSGDGFILVMFRWQRAKLRRRRRRRAAIYILSIAAAVVFAFVSPVYRLLTGFLFILNSVMNYLQLILSSSNSKTSTYDDFGTNL